MKKNSLIANTFMSFSIIIIQFFFVSIVYAKQITNSDNLNSEIWLAQNSGTDSTLLSVAYGDRKFVAVGTEGTILTSENGMTWTPQVSGTSNQLNAVQFGQDGFYAVGGLGVILHSKDGINWQKETSPTEKNLRAIAIETGSNPRAVIVGNEGVILKLQSKDWVIVNSPTHYTLRGAIIYGGRRYTVVGDRGTIFTSDDNGESWVKREGGTGATINSINGAHTDSVNRGKELVATCNDGTYLESPDNGETWNIESAPENESLTASYSGPFSKWVFSYSGNIFVKPDNRDDKGTWVKATINGNLDEITAAATNGIYFVAVGNKGLILRHGPFLGNLRKTENFSSMKVLFFNGQYYLPFLSSNSYGFKKQHFIGIGTHNGTTWQMMPITLPDDRESLDGGLLPFASNGSKFIIPGGTFGNNLLESSDAITWEKINDVTGLTSRPNQLIWGDNKFIALGGVGVSNQIYSSTNAVNWDVSERIQSLNTLNYLNAMYIGAAGAKVYTSSNAITWIPHNLPTDAGAGITSGGALAFGDRTFVLAEYDIYTSKDNGNSWTKSWSREHLPYFLWNSVSWGNNIFVAVGSDRSSTHTLSKIMTSPDGVNWSPSITLENENLYSVSYYDNQFLVIGSDGIFTSANGTEWKRIV